MAATKAYDVTVAYRINPRIAKAPAAFADDKRKLAELCLKSFRDSIGELRVKLLVLLDGCPPEYGELFTRYFAPDDLELIPLSGVGNRATFWRQVELLTEQNTSELVYFAEDDYFYLPDQFASMVRFMQTNPDVEFATPYDHLDYYTAPFHHYSKGTSAFEGRTWRTVASTCLTFLTSRSVLRRTKPVFRTYAISRRNTDFGIWFSLTKVRIRKPLTVFIGFTGQFVLLAGFMIAWYYNWRQILFGKKWRLWAPAPGIATHMDSRFMSPGYDWQQILADRMKSIK